MANNTFNIDDYLTPTASVGNSPEQSQQFQSFNIDDYLGVTGKDITGLGKKQAAEFGNQLAKFSHATPVQQYQAFEKYGQQYQNHLAQQGYSPTQIAQALTEFNANADPRNQTGLFEYYIGDRVNDVMIGTGNLIGDALAAVPEAIPVLGQWADNAEKYVKNTTKAWQNDLSAKNQINTYLGEKAYQDKRAEGASEFSATLSSLYENPMQVTSLITQQVPQLLLGAAGKATLAGVNMAGAAGRDRKDIEEAYEKTFKENPEQLLKLPEIQERMAQGMTFEQAVNDAKTDVSDHWKSILASALIGGAEALSPLGKFGQGVNRGVLKTLSKEMGQEALPEGAEQLKSNLAVGEIDGKTGAFDEVVRNATLGAVAGLGTGIPTAIEAGLNGRTESDADIGQILNRSAEGAKNANAQAKAQGESQQANSTNTQSTTGQSSVDEQILESVVSGVADEELRNQYFDELKSSIQDGSIVQEAEQNTAFGRFAKAYMDQAQAKAVVEPQTTQTEKPLQDGKDYVMVSTDVLDMTKIRDITDQNINQVSLEEIEKRAKDELTPREYREAVKILKSRKAEDYDENGELIEKYKAPQQAVENAQDIANQPEQETQTTQAETVTPDLETDSAVETQTVPENVNRIDETQLQQYEQELNQLISDVQTGQITPNAITARYADIIDRYPNHNELSAELSSRKQRVQEIENDLTLDDETKAEQTLYSRSPMKSVEANIKRGQERMTQAILDKADVKRGMYNQEFGWVDFVWGDDGTTKPLDKKGNPKGKGISHIIEARMRKNGMSEAQATDMLVNEVVETIAKGSIVNTNPKAKLELDYRSPRDGKVYRATLVKNAGNNAWVLTAFDNSFRYVMNEGASREGKDISTPTNTSPTLTRADTGASFVASDSEQFANTNGLSNDTAFELGRPNSKSQLNDTHTHSQRGRGVVADNGLNLNNSQQVVNPQITQDQQTLSRILGEETASHIQVVDRNTKVPSGRDVKQLATKGVEGWFEPSTQKLYIISDNITANDVLSRDERLAWVAFHELAHAGVRIKYGHLLTNVLASASQNVVVKVLARKIQAEHGYEREIAIEEAMMEIYAAYETGNWAELESRYKTKIHESYKQGKNSVGDFLTRVANALRRLIGGIIGKDLTQTMTTSQVFDTLRGIQQGINDIAKTEQNQTASVNSDVRYSLNEEPSSEFAKQAEPKRRASSFDEARAIVSEFLGEPLVNKATGMVATVSKRSLEKMVSGKAAKQSSSLHDHLMAVANIDSLFENAVNGWTEQHRTNDPNIAGVQRLFAPLLIDGEMKLAKVTVKAMNFDQGNRIYTVETIEVENENGTLGNLEASIDENQHTSPQSANVKSLIQRIKDFNSSDENSDNIRYSVKQSAMEQAKSGKSIPRETLLDQALSLDMETYKTLFQKGKSKIAEQLADSKMPVIDFINQWKNVKAADKQRIIQALQRAEITRDTERGKLEQVYTKPILEGLVEFTKDSKLDLFTIKRLVGFWISARWSIEKNQMLLEQDRKAMDEAKAIYDSALANSQDSEVIDRADLDYRRAKRQYENRKHDVELDLGSDYSNKAFKVGTAGGWSIPEAKLLMQYIEQRLPVNKMKVLAEKVYDLNQALLKLDNESGRYTDEQLAEYSSHRHYVPLTGDNGDSDIDFIGGVAQKAFNIGKDKRLLGRKNSEAEDAFDAVWKSLGKTTQYYGWADFKHGLAETFDNRVAELKKTGLAEKTAKELASEELGFSKTLQKGSTRTSDDALIFKEDGKYYEMELPPDVAGSLRGDNLESTATPFMRALNWLLTKPTRLMARGVTQLTVDFPIINMVRDIMGKAIYIAHEPMYDANGNEISVSERYKIGFSVYKEAVKSLLNPKDNLFAATFKHAWGAKLNNTGLQADLQELIDNGGFSTFTNNIARSEADFVKQLKTQNSQLRKGLAFLAHLLNTWSGMFDAVSSLATYRALKANGIDAEQAAGLVLETANFNKKGASLTNARGMYMFLQPKMMDAQKMMQILSTKRGVAELTARTVVMSGLYAALGSFWAYVLGDDEDKDEGGYLLDQLGDITGYIPIPLGEGMRNLISEWTGLENIKGNYFKLHLGFGMNQLAWNMAFNLNRAATGSEKWGDALVNIAMNWTKNFAPVTPSEISATSDPLNKLGQTIMPSSVLPLFQVATNKTAFGSSITATNVNSEEVKATQAKPNTAPEWEAASSWILDNLGIDMHPETVKHLVTSYSIMAGSAREYLTVAIENPNRERLGKTQRIPVLNRIFGMPNENSIPNKYYEYSNQIKESTRLYNRYKEIGDVEKMSGLAQEVKFGKILQDRYKPISKEKTNLKKQLNEGKLTQQVYDNRMLIIRRKEEAMQRQAVRMLRQSEGLTTN